MIRHALACLTVAGALLAGPGALALDAISVTANPIALDPQDPETRTFGGLDFLGGLELSSPDPRFGGLSGLEIRDDGRIVAITDQGSWLSARLRTDDSGAPIAIEDARMGAMRDERGQPLQGYWRDAEGLVLTAEGDALVSFERHHRVWRYPLSTDGFDAAATAVDMPPDVQGLNRNKGLEALALLPEERLLVLSERTETPEGDILGFVEADGAMARLAVAPEGIFHLTDAAMLADGRVAILERRFTLIGGVGMRIRAVDTADIAPGARLEGEEVVNLAARYNIDNMEGLAARAMPDGSTVLYAISDDNFSPLQRTLLLAFRVPAE